MNKDMGFAVAFVLVLIALAVGAYNREGSLQGNATSTPIIGTGTQISAQPPQDQGLSWGSLGGGGSSATTPQPTTRLSDVEIERRLESLYNELDNLTEKLRAAKLREPASPYVGTVLLNLGNARDTENEREYLMLRADSRNTSPIDISDWYIESYVTNERAALPKGDRIVEKWRSPVKENILLAPGEEAYLLTGDSPIDTSFHENSCTGYLENEEVFYPSLYNNCPRPLDEMERFANIDLDNDSCYDFVERIRSCEIVSDEVLGEADLTSSCNRFVLENLDYNHCVANHRYDPLFDNVGLWRIYFERSRELWRSEREILRLMDGNDRVIDVIEY